MPNKNKNYDTTKRKSVRNKVLDLSIICLDDTADESSSDSIIYVSSNISGSHKSKTTEITTNRNKEITQITNESEDNANVAGISKTYNLRNSANRKQYNLRSSSYNSKETAPAEDNDKNEYDPSKTTLGNPCEKFEQDYKLKLVKTEIDNQPNNINATAVKPEPLDTDQTENGQNESAPLKTNSSSNNDKVTKKKAQRKSKTKADKFRRVTRPQQNAMEPCSSKSLESLNQKFEARSDTDCFQSNSKKRKAVKEEPIVGVKDGDSEMKTLKLIKKEIDSNDETNKQVELVKNHIDKSPRLDNIIYEEQTAKAEPIDKLVPDIVEAETKPVLLSIDTQLLKQLKPHQVAGVKFMWDTCFGTYEQCFNSSGSGCILAHCNGLGKSLQIVTLVHTLLTHSDVTNVYRVLVITPVSCILNWSDEFRKWLAFCEKNKNIKIYKSYQYARDFKHDFKLREWYHFGGVLILSYDRFKNLAKNSTRFRGPIRTWLINPGPDMVVCDEPHSVKNEYTRAAVNRIKTFRRIILTGTPLQNNIKEAFDMVQLVNPNLLSNSNEFMNLFAEPIANGQYINSSPAEKLLMKKRFHILHKLLGGFVHQLDYAVLKPFLPPKHEYVISIPLTEVQIRLYKYYMQHMSGRVNLTKNTSTFITDFNNLQRICTHPRELYHATKYTEWWKSMVTDNDLNCLRSSGKLMLLFSILKACKSVGDKLLVLSQSPNSLNLIEHFLKLFDKKNNHKNANKNDDTCGFIDSWKLGKDYFKLDCSASIEHHHNSWINIFNDINNKTARLFLISTQSGGLAINLASANRIIIFDVPSKPSYDIQSILRVCCLGQIKPCFIYRFIALGSMEEKLFDQQVRKFALPTIAEQQIDRDWQYRENDLMTFYRYEIEPKEPHAILIAPTDRLLADLLTMNQQLIFKYQVHDSLLENLVEDTLNEEERTVAFEEFETDVYKFRKNKK